MLVIRNGCENHNYLFRVSLIPSNNSNNMNKLRLITLISKTFEMLATFSLEIDLVQSRYHAHTLNFIIFM